MSDFRADFGCRCKSESALRSTVSQHSLDDRPPKTTSTISRFN